MEGVGGSLIESLAGIVLPDASGSVEVSVVVPCYEAESLIPRLLDSLAAQTLDVSLFEVVFVLNGPPDGTEQVIVERFRHLPLFNYRVLHSAATTASAARNAGTAAARGTHLTWVDVDDWISPGYLELLRNSIAAGVVPLAGMLDCDEETGETRPSPMVLEILAREAGVQAPQDLTRALMVTAGKLVRTEHAQAFLFDESLRSGEDVAFFAPFIAAHGLRFDTRPAHQGAVYYRLVRAGSLSRQPATFDFMVTQRIDVIKHLDAAMVVYHDSGLVEAMQALIESQAEFTQRFLSAQPHERARAVQAYRRAGLTRVPWHLLTEPSPT